MKNSFDIAVAFMQLFLLVLWEALGALYFGWSPVTIFFSWLVGIFTLNVGVATVLRTFLKLTTPGYEVVNNVNITEEDQVG